MPELKKINHEIFARNVIKHKGHLTKAYQETRPEISYKTANREASRLFNTPIINERITELLNEQGLSLPELSHKLSSLVNHQKAIIVKNKIEYVPDGTVQVDSVKTAFKLHGLLQNNQASIEDNRQVNIVVNENHIDKLDGILSKLETLAGTIKDQNVEYKEINQAAEPEKTE